MLGTRLSKRFEDKFIHLDAIPACVTQTERHTQTPHDDNSPCHAVTQAKTTRTKAHTGNRVNVDRRHVTTKQA